MVESGVGGLVRFSPINFCIFCTFCVGCLINTLAYQSLQPTILAVIMVSAAMFLLIVTPFRGYYERRVFALAFSVGWLMAGVAAIYAEVLGDPFQFTNDAGVFFDQTSDGQMNHLTLIEIQATYENALPIVVWREFYNVLAAVGFSRDRFVGILVNVLLVASTGVLAIKMARLIFGEDPARFKRLILLFTSCGLLWLFAGIHMRDALILFSITLLAYAWLYFLVSPDFGIRLLVIVVVTLFSSQLMGFLRAEFVFVPVAMAAAGSAALILKHKTGIRRIISYVVLLVGLVMSAVLLLKYGDALLLALNAGHEGYLEQTQIESAEDSLGNALIVSQPIPVRLVLGAVYLYVSPIPFWSGFQSESVYHVFKSFSALFFYFVIPLLLLSVWQIWKDGHKRKTAFLFVLFLTLGFTISIAGTSLETRHLGVFLVPIFLLSLVPDLNSRDTRRSYKRLLVVMFLCVVLMHMAWAYMKFI